MTRPSSGGNAIVVPANRRKALLLLAISTAFVAAGISFIVAGDKKGWMAVAFCGTCLAIAVAMLLPGSTSLVIDSSGVRMRLLFKSTLIRWQDVDSFHIGSIKSGVTSTKMIGIHYSASYTQAAGARRIASALTGMEGGIPMHFNMPAKDLCDLLNASKKRWSTVA